MSEPEESQRVCEHCGAPLPPDADTCPLCLGHRDPAMPTGESPFDQTESHAPVQFSLASMMLWMTLAAVVLGAFSVFYPLGVVLLILAMPAAIRTAILSSQRGVAGRPLDMQTKAKVFLGTMGLLAAIAISVVGAFVATCFPLGVAGFGAQSGFLIGFALLAGIGAAIFVLWVLVRKSRRFWPRGE